MVHVRDGSVCKRQRWEPRWGIEEGHVSLDLLAREEGFPGQPECLCRVWHSREPTVLWFVIAGCSVCYTGLMEVVDKKEDGSQ